MRMVQITWSHLNKMMEVRIMFVRFIKSRAEGRGEMEMEMERRKISVSIPSLHRTINTPTHSKCWSAHLHRIENSCTTQKFPASKFICHLIPVIVRNGNDDQGGGTGAFELDEQSTRTQ